MRRCCQVHACKLIQWFFVSFLNCRFFIIIICNGHYSNCVYPLSCGHIRNRFTKNMIRILSDDVCVFLCSAQRRTPVGVLFMNCLIELVTVRCAQQWTALFVSTRPCLQCRESMNVAAALERTANHTLMRHRSQYNTNLQHITSY